MKNFMNNSLLSVLMIISFNSADAQTTQGPQGTDQLRVTSSNKFTQQAYNKAMVEMDEINRVAKELYPNASHVDLSHYSSVAEQKKCEAEDLYIRSLYNSFLTTHRDLIETIITHLRTKLNLSFNALDDLRSSDATITVGKQNLTVKTFIEKLIQYDLDIQNQKIIDFNALGITPEEIKLGLIEVNKILALPLPNQPISEIEGRFLSLSQSNPARIIVNTKIAGHPQFKGRVKSVSNFEKTWMLAEQTLSECIGAVSDESVLRLIELHRVSIDQVPIDGVQRRIYFDKFRSLPCKKMNMSYKKMKSTGIYSEASKDPCIVENGLHIISGFISNEKQTLPLKQEFYEATEGKMSYNLGGSFGSAPWNPHTPSGNYIAPYHMMIRFTCGCQAVELCAVYKIAECKQFAISCTGTDAAQLSGDHTFSREMKAVPCNGTQEWEKK